MENKTIINFCPTGMVPKKANNPSVPVFPNEIIEQVHQANEIGITIAHLHARDAFEVPTYKKTVYREIIEGIRKHCPDLVICLSTSGRNFPEFEKRSEVIELRPDMCSLTLSSLNFANQASINEPKMVLNLLAKMKEYGVSPELECFDLGMVNYGKYLLNKLGIEKKSYWNILLGNIAGLQPTFDQIGTVISQIPHGHYVALAGLGKYQLEVNALAVASGVGVRVGLEDNIWFDRERTTLATNETLLKRVHQLMVLNERELMPSKEFGNLGFYNEQNKYIGQRG